ncbi:MAG TPA: type II secretion system protein [Candidatus Paceibacterota bacterium]
MKIQFLSKKSGFISATAIKNRRAGFTLIEILVVIGLIAILATIVIVAINPARQFAQARNSQRTSNVNAILNAIGQNLADNKGIFTCTTVPGAVIDDTLRNIEDGAAAGISNLRPCIVPTYMSEIPYDPSMSGAHVTSDTDYDTKYKVQKNATTQRITVCAPGSVEAALGSPPEICVTR